MATSNKTTKKVVKKQSKFPFLKEHQKDPAVCKCCGKRIGVSFLIGGMCKACNFKMNEITQEYKRGFKVTKLEVTDISGLM